MDNDDLLVGQVLDRREALRLLAIAGAAAITGCSRERSAGAADTSAMAAGTSTLPGCVARPELTVGPYFVDQQLDRSDVRVEPSTGTMKEGAALALAFNVSRIDGGSCAPLAGAMVDVWQCDAAGAYSGVNDQMVGFNTVGQKFLRGYQTTDAKGVARFVTIYPGWYQGRTVHIHFKVRVPAGAPGASTGAYEFTSQLFFDDALTDQVHARAPYAAKGQRDLRNDQDGIYREAGSGLVLATVADGAGYRAAFDLGLDLTNAAVGKADSMGGPRGPGGPPPGGPPRGERRPPPRRPT